MEQALGAIVIKKVYLVGGYPPPYGGITVHIKRLKALLESRGIDVTVLDFLNPRSNQSVPGVISFNDGNRVVAIFRVSLWLLFRKKGVVHFHVSALGNFLYAGLPLLLASAGSKKIITIHSGSFIKNAERFSKFKWGLFKLFKFFVDQWVVVSQEQGEFLRRKLAFFEERVTVVPAFIPPNIRENEIETELVECINQIRSKHNRVAIVSGFMERHYGHHLVLEAMQSTDPLEIGVIFCFYSSYDENYRSELELLKSKLDNVYFMYDLVPECFTFLLKESDLFIRATDRDGDAVSIREAMHYRKAVIASDCVRRPDGTILFTTGSSEALRDRLQQFERGVVVSQDGSEHSSILDVYDRFLAPAE